MQSVSSRIWTRVAESISYDDNHYTTGTSNELLNTSQKTGPYFIWLENNSHFVDFTVPADYRVKERDTINKYHDLTRCKKETKKNTREETK